MIKPRVFLPYGLGKVELVRHTNSDLEKPAIESKIILNEIKNLQNIIAINKRGEKLDSMSEIINYMEKDIERQKSIVANIDKLKTTREDNVAPVKEVDDPLKKQFEEAAEYRKKMEELEPAKEEPKAEVVYTQTPKKKVLKKVPVAKKKVVSILKRSASMEEARKPRWQ
jgi:hypothetical protein